jgi:selenocysteine-specific elongation factor
LVPLRGDRVVIRQIAPPDTLGGGVVLDASPRRHGPSRELLARLERLEKGEEPLPPKPPPGPRAFASGPSGGLRQCAQPLRGEHAPLTPQQLALEQRLRDAGLTPPLDTDLDPEDLAALRAAGRAVRVSRTLHYHRDVLDQAQRRVVALAEERGGAVTLAQLRDELGTSRKFAQALLEHLDSEKVTVRRGDAHYVRRSSRAPS